MEVTAILIVLVLLAASLVGYLVWARSSEPDPSPRAVNPEQAVKAAVELHRIRRRFDASWTRSQQRRDAARVKREIAEAFKGDDG